MDHISCSTLGIALVFSLGVGQARALPQTYVLDFVADKPSHPESRDERERQTGTTQLTVWGENDGTFPFQMTLVDLDRSGYAIGDGFIFELVLKHVGTKPFPFPWSRDPKIVNPNVPGARQAAFLLNFKDSVIGPQLLATENITYGADSVPGSLVVLQPGDTVRVRGEGQWYLTRATSKPPPDGWIRDLTLSAQLQISGLKGFQPLLDSTNQLQIQLRQRR